MTVPRPVRASLGAAIACLLLLTGCSSLQGTNDLGYVPGDGQVLQIDPADRGKPIELTGTSLEGTPLDIADDRGEVVVVNVWWSGCGPCITEMPMLTQAQGELGSDVSFLGINIRDSSAATALAFERGVGVAYPSFYEPGGKALLAFDGKVSLQATPSTAVLDREGRVAAVISGPIPGAVTLKDVIEQVAAENG